MELVTDANMYWVPEEIFTNKMLQEKLLNVIPEQYEWYARVETVPGTDKKQFIFEKPKGFANLNYVQGDYTLEKELKDMDEAGVDRGVMKLPGTAEWLDIELCRYFNDAAAAHAAESGGRLTALAVVPPYSTQENLDELERCRNKLGLKCIQLACHYGDRYLDDPAFEGFFTALNELGMNAYVHHTPVPVEFETFRTYDNVRRSYGRIVDQGLAVSREMYSGFFQKYPNVCMIHSMMGGAFYAIQAMMLPHGPSKHKDEVQRFSSDSGDLTESMKKHLFFEMSHAQPWSKSGLEYAVSVVGADKIVYGSSYPVKMDWMMEGPAFVKALDLSEEDKDLMLNGNAERLYQL